METLSMWRAVAPSDALSLLVETSNRRLRRGGRSYHPVAARPIQLIDPFTGANVRFTSALKADNWLLRNFCPGTARSEVLASGLRYARRGFNYVAPCDLLTEFEDRVRIADLVISHGELFGGRELMQLERVAGAVGIVAQLRSDADIRANLVLLRNCAHMCKHLAVHGKENWHHEDRILAALPSSEAITVLELRKEMWRAESRVLSTPEFSSALFRAYRRGTITINLAQMDYGPGSIVAYA